MRRGAGDELAAGVQRVRCSMMQHKLQHKIFKRIF